MYRWTTSEVSGIRRMARVANAQIRELCGVKKGIGERIMKLFSGGSGM